MKKIILITLLVFFIVTGQGLSGNRDRYESSDHKFRSQFNDNEWREHQARSERYFRARHPEYYLYREDRRYHRHKRDYYRCKDSFEYDGRYEYDWRDDSDGYDWDDYNDHWEDDEWGWDEYRHEHRNGWD